MTKKEFIENHYKCRQCNKSVTKEDADAMVGYISGSYYLAHKECRAIAEKQKAWDIQNNIDRDCNDCKHFTNRKEIGKGIYKGLCNKFDMPVKAYSKICTNHECFEHRKERPE